MLWLIKAELWNEDILTPLALASDDEATKNSSLVNATRGMRRW
jgi:hypothetical protein